MNSLQVVGSWAHGLQPKWIFKKSCCKLVLWYQFAWNENILIWTTPTKNDHKQIIPKIFKNIFLSLLKGIRNVSVVSKIQNTNIISILRWMEQMNSFVGPV